MSAAGTAGHAKACSGRAVQATAWLSGLGLAAEVWQADAGLGAESPGSAGSGVDWHGRRALAGRREGWPGPARPGEAWQAGLGGARRLKAVLGSAGASGRGPARQGRARPGGAWHDTAGRTGLGRTRLVLAGRDMATFNNQLHKEH